MKPGSLDSYGDVEYYVFLHFCSTIFSFCDIQLLRALFGTHYVTVLTWGEGEATLHVNRCSKLAVSGLRFDLQ